MPVYQSLFAEALSLQYTPKEKRKFADMETYVLPEAVLERTFYNDNYNLGAVQEHNLNQSRKRPRLHYAREDIPVGQLPSLV